MLVNLAIALDCELGELLEDGWLAWYAFDKTNAPEPPEFVVRRSLAG